MSDGRPTYSVAKLALAAKQARDVSDVIGADPIAVVGMACRFPGSESPEAFWRLLAGGVDAITEVPPTRWDVKHYYDPDPSRPGKITTRWGSFLDEIDHFDAAHFGISAREAAAIDPQQRLLLEVVCEALDDAGQSGQTLRGSQTGVFLAVYNTDYLQALHSDRTAISAYSTVGTVPCIAAGRISYHFDLRGPSLVVDTACSSSLVAVHLACESLRVRTSNLAVVGGASLLLSPERTISLSKWGFMSPEGRCKPFDAGANGWVRGEGCGVVVLRRLSDALAAGDRILAVIRGTAINQDGRSTVLTAPNGAAQVAVIRQALENGHVSPADIDYIEAHGTGTVVGDPIEFEALDEAIGQQPDAAPCLIGAVKANVGHLEAAAGIAGLIKTVLALGHEAIPPQLHFHQLNPLLSFEGTRLRIVPGGAPWLRGAKRRFAGVSSFGFSGTNAHVVVEEAPTLPHTTTTVETAGPQFLTLSARSVASLSRAAHAYLHALSPGGDLADTPIDDVCFTAGLKRHQHEQRLAVVGRTREDLIKGLQSYLAGERSWTVVQGRAPASTQPGAVFVFSGQGSQWAGMGRALIESEEVARRTFEECADLVERLGGPSLHDEIHREERDSRLSSTSVAQPAILALQLAVAAQLRAWGIEPAAVVGHSAGEVAAAHVAGALSLENAIRIVALRSLRMEAATDRGKMLAAALSRRDAEEIVQASNGDLSLASANAAAAVVLSGEVKAIEECRRLLVKQGTWCQALDLRYAFHSHQMADVCAGLAQDLKGLVPSKTTIPFVSSVIGKQISGESLTADYWERNAVQTVEFSSAIESLVASGQRRFVEIGPHPVLGGYIASALDSTAPSLVIGTLHRRRDDRLALRATAAALHVSGIPVDLKRLVPRARIVSLPAYAWDRQRHWAAEFDAAQAFAETRDVGRIAPASLAPLIDRELATPWSDRRVFETSLSTQRPAYVADHRIRGQVLFPATGFLAMAASAACSVFGRAAQLEDVFIHAPLVLTNDEATVQIGMQPQADGSASFEIFSRCSAADSWTKHVSGRMRVQGLQDRADRPPLDDLKAPATTLDAATFYASLDKAGIQFGPAFRSVETVNVQDGRVVARVSLPATAGDWNTDASMHPALLDGCLQGIWGVTATSGSHGALVPIAFARIRQYGRSGSSLVVHIECAQAADGRSWQANLTARDEKGGIVAEIDGHVATPYPDSVASQTSTLVQQIEWHSPVETDLPSPLPPCSWLILADRGGTGLELAPLLKEAGHRCRVVLRDPGGNLGDALMADPTDPKAVHQIVQDFIATSAAPRHVVHLWNLDAGWSSETHQSWADDFTNTCASTLHVLQAIASAPADISSITLVTRSSQAVEPNDDTNPAQSLAWGLGRVIDHEFPELVCRRIDLPSSEPAVATGLRDQLLQQGGERELAWRNGSWLTPRVCTVADEATVLSSPVVLEIAQRGLLDNLRLVGQTPPVPPSDEVLIRVSASGMNFRDVLNALGMYPGEAGPLGNECVGEIAAVGRDVMGLKLGDRVAAVGSSCFATFVTTKASLVAPLPPTLNPIDAATIPIVFLTAETALVELARLQPGERVLIHAGAGGVGLAALQIALRIGAEVYATAGTPEKRDYLRSLGVCHVADSRRTDFASEIWAASGGRGVDVVLNSLAGDFIPRSLDILAPGGRFVEIGKAGIWDEGRVRSRRPDAKYWVLFLGDEIQNHPERIGERLRNLLNRCANGELQPLPRRTFPLESAPAAFRFMAQARHIGKVVLVAEQAETPVEMKPDGAYLVTGGLGSLGLHAARWLVDHGARHLVLVGRSVPEDLSAVDKLREQATVDIERCDVTSADDVQRLIGYFGTIRPVLRGVVHAAGALHDGMLVRQQWPDFEKGLGVKVLGSWYLHRATLRMPLDFFVSYSSVASVIGSLGQGSYAAANAFMDSFAYARRAEGLPALSISWGSWERGGMAARLAETDRARLTAAGFVPLSDSAADTVLTRLIGSKLVHALGVSANWPAYVEQHPNKRSLFAAFLPKSNESRTATAAIPSGEPSVAETLEHSPGDERPSMLARHVRTRVLKLVGLPADRMIDEQLGFREIGLDSLLAVELRNALQADLKLSLPATMAFDYPTVSSLTEHLLTLLGFAKATGAMPDLHANQADRTADEVSIDDLSEAEAEALLEAEIETLARNSRRAN